MNVTLVPFGNAQIDTATKTVTCQHGQTECDGNLWEMCAISHYPAFSAHWPFYYCMESLGEAMVETDNVKKCANESGMEYGVLNRCFHNPKEAWALEQHFAALTPADHTYTPWVEVPTGTVLSNDALFLFTVCEQYAAGGGVLPSGCPQASAKKAERCYASS